MSNQPKTNPDLLRLCRVWQKRLRLQDWDVDVRFAISREETHDNAGLTSMCRNDKSATIRVCPKSLADPDWLGIVDTEITLVHELQHLHASGFDRLVKKEDEEAYRALEVMIDKTAHALVTLSRK